MNKPFILLRSMSLRFRGNFPVSGRRCFSMKAWICSPPRNVRSAILEYLHTHYREKITLDGLAKHVNISKSECCRFFRKHMKLSLFDYLLDYRVEQSLPLLREKDLSITQIAEQTGFGGSAYFAKIFKKEMGISPSQYRKSGRNPGAFS